MRPVPRHPPRQFKSSTRERLCRLFVGNGSCSSKDSLVTVPDEGQSCGIRAKQCDLADDFDDRTDPERARLVLVRSYHGLGISTGQGPENERRRSDGVVVLKKPLGTLRDTGGFDVGEGIRGMKALTGLSSLCANAVNMPGHKTPAERDSVTVARWAGTLMANANL